MEQRKENDFAEVLENEVDDIWDIFFPYMKEPQEKNAEISVSEKARPRRRNLRFLTM